MSTRSEPLNAKLSTQQVLDSAFIAAMEQGRNTREQKQSARGGGNAPLDERRSKAAAATTAAEVDDDDAGLAAAAMGALTAAPRPADLAAVDLTLPPER